MNSDWPIQPLVIKKALEETTVSNAGNYRPPDINKHTGWLKGRECPQCYYSGGFIWEYPPCRVTITDRSIMHTFLDRHPIDTDTVMCECCGNSGPFSAWHLTEQQLEDPQKYWDHGDSVACFKRRSGMGRTRVFDLYRFNAKRGVDKVIRWCIDRNQLCENVRDTEIARHICKHLKIQYVDEHLRHRQPVVTRASVAEKSLVNI